MNKIILALLLGVTALFAKDIAVAGDEYLIRKDKKIDLIYSKEFGSLSSQVLEDESRVLREYEKSFGYPLDEKLYLSLISSNNQIANAFSTQMPFNMQVDYIGGALHPDYFASKSWINTLLYHESAHNFQINPKKNLLSKYAHKIFKNSLYNNILLPIFPIPNNFCSPFNLEGNAVLNESWHGNGGRLYNGTLKALALTQALAGYVTAQRTYNQHLFFPYETHNYIVGGYFWLFLSERFGLDKANRYFYNFSGQWIPIFTNNIFKDTFGIDYEEAIKEYSTWLKNKAKSFKKSDGKVLARSKSMLKMNKIDDEILFLSSNDRDIPKLNRYDIKSSKLRQKTSTLRVGRVFKIKNRYYTLTSSYTNPTNISIGLFDEDGKAYKKSLSKSIEYISPDGKDMIFFDIKRSFQEPFAFRNSKEIGTINSSIFVDKKGSIYYFKQDGQTRTLYKDNRALFSFKAWFGFVSDVDENGIYIVANTKQGSSLFRFSNGSLSRVLRSDDIVDAKLISKNSVLIETIDEDGVAFRLDSLKDEPSSIYFPKLKLSSSNNQTISKELSRSKAQKYTPLSNLHYSSLDAELIYTENEEFDYDFTARFTDPLGQNSLSLFISKFDDSSIAGIGYDNSQFRMKFGASIYAVLDSDQNTSTRDYGINSFIKYPFYHTMYKRIDSTLSYTLNSDKDAKSPLTLTLSLSDARAFGHSMYLNYGNFLDISYALDRGDSAYGLKSYFAREFSNEFYYDFHIAAAYSQLKDHGKKRGIKIDSYQNRFDDALNFVMPSLKRDLYARSIIKSGLGLKKVLNFNKYFFTFPISLRRESIYFRYNNYNIEFKDKSSRNFNELTLGLKADLLYFNSYPLPISFEYLYNPDLKDSSDMRIIFNMMF